MSKVVNLFDADEDNNSPTNRDKLNEYLDRLKSKKKLKMLAITIDEDEGVGIMLNMKYGAEMLVTSHYLKTFIDDVIASTGVQMYDWEDI